MGDSAVKVAVIDAITYNNHSDFDFGTDGYRNVLWTLGNDYTGIPSNSYHGLSVAGVIGTKTNNSIGIAGLGGGYNDYGVGIIPYNVSSGGFIIDMSVVDDAIIDATDKGAKVINMSFGSNLSAYEDIDDAIEYASSHGVILTAASLPAGAYTHAHSEKSMQNDTSMHEKAQNLSLYHPSVTLSVTN